MAELQSDSLTRSVSDRVVGLLNAHSTINSVAALSRATNIDRGLLSLKLHGKRKLYLDDVSAIAVALDTTIAYLVAETANPSRRRGNAVIGSSNVDVVGDFSPYAGEELSRRLAFLQQTSVSTALETLPNDHPFHATPEEWENLLSARGTVHVSHQTLTFLSDFFHVPIDYLELTTAPDTTERIEAEVQFDRAAFDNGATRVAARALGSLSVAEIKALTEAIKER